MKSLLHPARASHMLHTRTLFVLLFLITSAQAQSAKEPPKTPNPVPPPPKVEPLTLEKLFPKDGLFGPTAHGMAFSHDGKYAAYLHRPLSERKNGNDIWLLDMTSGKKRI